MRNGGGSMVDDSDRARVSKMFSAIHYACDMPDWRGFCNCVLGGDASPSPLRKLKAFARLAQLVAPQQRSEPSAAAMAKAEYLRAIAGGASYRVVPMRPSELMEIAEMLERGGRDD